MQVKALAIHTRDRSRIYRIRLSRNDRAHSIVVKEPRSVIRESSTESQVPTRPRLVPHPEIHTRFHSEFLTLRSVERALSEETERFNVVRALDFIESRSAIVTEELQGTTLRRLMSRHTRLHFFRRAGDLRLPFVNAGAWLRAYHRLDAAGAVPRHDTRRAVLDFTADITQYLAATGTEGSLFLKVGDAIVRAAAESLPDTLPVVLGHGDFAMRNVIVDAKGRVASLDMWNRWRTAPYEDIAYFLVAMRNSRPQSVMQGALFDESTLGHWESAFIAGYYAGQPPPMQPIRIYQLLMLLDTWAARPPSAMRHRSATLALKWTLIGRAFEREASRLLESL